MAVSAVGLAATGGIEFAIALLNGSVGLLSDTLHNLSDASTSAVVFFGFWISKKAHTARYPYGYERAEDLPAWALRGATGSPAHRRSGSIAGTSILPTGIRASTRPVAGCTPRPRGSEAFRSGPGSRRRFGPV